MTAPTKRRPGRPAIGTRVETMLPDAVLRRVRAEAKRTGMKVSEWIRSLIVERVGG